MISILHAEVAAPVGDELVDLLEAAGVEQPIDPLARRELSGVGLTAQTILSAAELGAPLQLLELHQTRATWAFSQSFRNFSSPMSVRGCLNN